MCGILGYIGERKIKEKLKIEALNSIRHRGPDNHQIINFSNNYFLGHTRLSIIDLEDRSNQPFKYKDYYLTYNGEIFNYKSLKNSLIKLGHNFNTNSDTEVIIHSYEEWGSECVKYFNGMWAFCIYDINEKIAFLSRDRFGIKPLKYSYVNNQLYFASETKAILPLLEKKATPNKTKIVNFIKESEGIFSKDTWFNEIKNLEPGTNLIFKDNYIKFEKYFRSFEKSHDRLSNNYLNELDRSIKLRLNSDVPVAFTISSGVDSTSIALIAKKYISNLKCYNAKFNHDESEHKLSSKFCLDNDLSIDFSVNHFSSYDDAKKLIYHLESGHQSTAIFPLFSLYKQISKDGYKVVLEGQGADELMAGYESSNYIYFLLDLIINLKILDFFKIIFSKKDFSLVESLNRYSRLILSDKMRDIIFYFRNGLVFKSKYFFTKRETRKLKSGYNYFINFLNKQYTQTLSSLLHYGDSISMIFSVESRLPFMDINLSNFIRSKSNNNLMGILNGKFTGKLIHKKNMIKYLPDYILNNKKKGFPAPVEQIISSDWANDIFNNLRFTLEYDIINKDFVNKLKNQDLSNIDKNLLYRILLTEVWFIVFFSKNKDE
tara:strand:- start:9883 stop:11688 length:1806 start_codon:yes stop_codon:yes gene_type:complete